MRTVTHDKKAGGWPRPGYARRSGGCVQPAPLMARGSKKRQPSGHAKGTAWFASTRHRSTCSPVGNVRLE